ncbi:MAG: response regulator transcription factor [Verrucomicrobiaceae bacterium]|nr:MAG: response regulator transcription factor [Verrucomicrobiaceae bacterium]
MTTTETPKIFIVEDHPMLREGLVRSIEGKEWTVCGYAESSAHALEEIPKLKPDLVTMDISLPDKNGLELVKDLRAMMPDLRILVLSMHDESLYAERAMRAGAKGYVMKGEGTEVILQAIDEVLKGGYYLSSKASDHLLRNMGGGKSRGVFGLDRLTDRELEVFELIGRGRSSGQISTQLHISPKTVDAHRTNIKTKLGIPDAPGLMRAAVLWIEQGKGGAAAEG